MPLGLLLSSSSLSSTRLPPFQRANSHKLIYNLFGDLGAAFLIRRDELRQRLDADLLQLTRHQFTLDVLLADPLDFLIVVVEEAQVLEGDIDVRVTAVFLLLF